MLELLAYLRANGFKTFIVSGGGVDFMRGFAERVYGIPPEQVIGSTGEVKFETARRQAGAVSCPPLQFLDDKEGKPIAIQRIIGRRPLAAFGNSNGHLQRPAGRCAAPAPRFCLFVDHTDAGREWADEDRQGSIGRPRQGPRRGQGPRLDGREHERRLEHHLPVPEEVAGRLFQRLVVVDADVTRRL